MCFYSIQRNGIIEIMIIKDGIKNNLERWNGGASRQETNGLILPTVNNV